METQESWWGSSSLSQKSKNKVQYVRQLNWRTFHCVSAWWKVCEVNCLIFFISPSSRARKDQCRSQSQVESEYFLPHPFVPFRPSKDFMMSHIGENNLLYSVCWFKYSHLETHSQIHPELIFKQISVDLVTPSSRHVKLTITNKVEG